MPKKYVRKTNSIAMSWAFRQLPFWDRVTAQTEMRGECEVFTGSLDDCGYGRIHADSGKLVRIHREVWEKVHGPIPSDKEICHTCDVRACIKASHLFLGTHAENIADMDKKGRRRTLRGSHRPMAKLSEEEIPAIRSMLLHGNSCADIARQYGVSEGLIRHIKKGRAWRHVP